MAFQINTREREGVTVFDLSGKLLLGEPTSLLREAVRAHTGGEPARIIFNMADVPHVDSGGMGEMVGCRATVTAGGGEIKLVNVQRRVIEPLVLTRLYTLFEILDSEDAALSSFVRAVGA